MTVSIVICTRNRAHSLRATLASIGHAVVPAGWRVELLLVDNGSTDATRRVVDGADLGPVVLRYVQEPRPGLCFARNTGLLQSSGDIILFADDDVRVPTNWIAGMCQRILDGSGDAVAGGVVFPADLASVLSRPPYSSHRGWFASTEEIDPEAPHRMVGANMAIHRRVLERVPGFEVELGAGALGFADETLFSGQLLTGGFKIASALDVAVEHHFDSARLSTANLLGLARRMGRSDAFTFHHWYHRRSRLAVPRLVWAQARRYSTRAADLVAGTVSTRTLRAEQDFAFCTEYLRQRRRARKYSFKGLVPQ